jgi:ubiquinone/menaquinone biosynthesis C-methylase UbiE
MTQGTSYIPALGFDLLTPLYDPIVHWLMQEERFKSQLVDQAAIQPHHRILDLGCGTGTLTLLAKQKHPAATITGLDGDARVLEIAQAKASQAGVSISLEQGLATSLPYADASFDRVLSSLLFHHLTLVDKARAFDEIYRVLVPGGEAHIADWGKAQNPFMRVAFLAIQILDGFTTTADNVAGRLPLLLGEAGFQEVRQVGSHQTIFGTLARYAARKPD